MSKRRNEMSNELERFPQFAIESVDDKRCLGTFDCDLVVGNDVWGYLMNVGNVSIEGKFYDFEKNTRRATFIPAEVNDLKLITINKRYVYFDGYWGAIAALILDDTLVWNETRFKPSDSHDDAGNVLKKGGWDHEHCDICWETISDKVPGNEIGYVSGNERKTEKWICKKCYIEQVLPRSLSNITDEIILTQIRNLKG